MVDKISIKDFVELPDKMLNNSKNVKYIQLLSEKTIKYYYYTDLKKELVNIFKRFKDSKYIISFADDFSLKSNASSYEISGNTNSINDKVGNYVENKIDLSIWSKDFYNILIHLSKELTFQETMYLIATFFEDMTEDDVCEKLDVCRKSLYKIKKSCLVKIKLEFDKFGLMS